LSLLFKAGVWCSVVGNVWQIVASCYLVCVCVCIGRSISQERSSASSWSELMTHPHKHKELANYCSLLQEHYYQSYVKGHKHMHIYV